MLSQVSTAAPHGAARLGTRCCAGRGDERDDGVDGVEHRVEAADLSVAAWVGSGCASGRDGEGLGVGHPVRCGHRYEPAGRGVDVAGPGGRQSRQVMPKVAKGRVVSRL